MKHSLMKKSATFIAAMMGLLLLSACAAAPARDADKYYDLKATIAPFFWKPTESGCSISKR